MSERRPRGYEGLRHETIGQDILAIPEAFARWHGDGGAKAPPLDKLLPARLLARLDEVVADQWYPIELLLELSEELAARVGPQALRKIGRVLFEVTHAQRVLAHAQCGFDIVNGIDAMYRHANRGERIGGWRVNQLDDVRARLEKTTPHHCALEEGILAQAFAAVGCRAIVEQERCFRDGADACELVVVWLGGRTRGQAIGKPVTRR